MTEKFDLICLGTGPAASTVATICAEQGLRVVVVESREFGGTCALRGCNPKKVFTNAAALVDQAQRAQGRLVTGNDLRIAWSKLVAFQHEFTDPVREKTEDKLTKRGITTVQGAASFESKNVIRVGDSLFEGDHIFAGVGARPAPLKIPGEHLVVTSDDFIELPSLPARVLFLGGGFISFEFAHAVVRAGSHVTIVDRHERPLKSFDPDLVSLLVDSSRAAGIDILTDTSANTVSETQDGLQVKLKRPTEDTLIDTDMVVHGGGRVPNLDGLNLEVADVAHDLQGITVNQFLQSTTNPRVYSAGDCANQGVPMLTPAATEAGRVAAANILASRTCGQPMSPQETVDRSRQPVEFGPVVEVVFSVPTLACVGLSESEARHDGIDLDVRFEDLSQKGEVRKLCNLTAGCKLLIERRTDRILGAHLLGPHADEVINLFALAIRFRLTAANLKSMLFGYPTMTAEFCRLL